ncbi:MAG: hypothetical protein ABI402_20640 [Ferruginibacter sp.]
MKASFFIISVVLLSCSSSKNNNNTAVTGQEQTTNKLNEQGLPDCIQKMIGQYKSEEKQNPPRQIYSYLYNGKTVYYVTPPCCDFFSDLYDSSCVLIGHPDGGFTGKGDGKTSDFKDMRTNEKLIWKDDRK